MQLGDSQVRSLPSLLFCCSMSAALRCGEQDCSIESLGIPLDKDYPVTMQHHQADMIEIAKMTNTLAFLPSTNDKMFVSFFVIKHCLVSAQRSVCSHKKSIALLSPTRYAEAFFHIRHTVLFDKALLDDKSGLK